MNADERAKLRVLADAATPGPWNQEGSSGDEHEVVGPGNRRICDIVDMGRHDDGAFIAAARGAVPALLGEVERLERDVQASVPVADLDSALADMQALMDEERGGAIQAVRDLLASIAAHPRGSIVPAQGWRNEDGTTTSIRDPRALHEPPARPETGPMRFGDDWTGVFIRGDNAGWYGLALRTLLESGHIDQMALGSLASDLGGCIHTNGEPEAQLARLVSDDEDDAQSTSWMHSWSCGDDYWQGSANTKDGAIAAGLRTRQDADGSTFFVAQMKRLAISEHDLEGNEVWDGKPPNWDEAKEPSNG